MLSISWVERRISMLCVSRCYLDTIFEIKIYPFPLPPFCPNIPAQAFDIIEYIMNILYSYWHLINILDKIKLRSLDRIKVTTKVTKWQSHFVKLSISFLNCIRQVRVGSARGFRGKRRVLIKALNLHFQNLSHLRRDLSDLNLKDACVMDTQSSASGLI